MDGYIVQQVLGHGQLKMGTYYSGWKHMPNGKWFYLIQKNHMLIGTVQVSGTSYYIDEYAGMISNSWIQLPVKMGLGSKMALLLWLV